MEQVFQLTAQHKHTVLRVLLFSFLSFILFLGVIILLIGVFPAEWGVPMFILSIIPLIFFLTKYTHSIGNYDVTLKSGSENLSIAPLFEEYNETVYLWADLKDFRWIKAPTKSGSGGIIYVRWQNGDSHHFSGQDSFEFYDFLKRNFPNKEWSFLGMPRKPSTR